MPAIQFGNATTALYYGSTKLVAAYYGAAQLWPVAAPTSYTYQFKWALDTTTSKFTSLDKGAPPFKMFPATTNLTGFYAHVRFSIQDNSGNVIDLSLTAPTSTMSLKYTTSAARTKAITLPNPMTLASNGVYLKHGASNSWAMVAYANTFPMTFTGVTNDILTQAGADPTQYNMVVDWLFDKNAAAPASWN